MAICVIAVVGVAPCQCFSLGANQTTSSRLSQAARLLLEANRRRSGTTTGRGRGTGCRPAGAQGPAFPQRRTITDLDRHAVALLVHLHPERIGFVESERLPGGRIKRSEDGRRFTRREDTTAHVALRTWILA